MEHLPLLSRGSEPLYRHGTLERAFQFANPLNRTPDIIYSTRMLTKEEAQELGPEAAAGALSLTLALAGES